MYPMVPLSVLRVNVLAPSNILVWSGFGFCLWGVDLLVCFRGCSSHDVMVADDERRSESDHAVMQTISAYFPRHGMCVLDHRSLLLAAAR